MGLGKRLIFANLWLFEPLVARILESNPATNAMVRTTTAPTMLEAGVKENVLASRARAVVNFRILPGETSETVLAHVREVVDDAELQIELIGKPDQPSPLSSDTSPAYRMLERTARQVFPTAVVAPSLVVGATDSRSYAPIADGVYRFVPITADASDLKRIHSTDERCSVEGYGRAVRFYAQLIRNLQ
jgi:carboxypeptidase PM20D1